MQAGTISLLVFNRRAVCLQSQYVAAGEGRGRTVRETHARSGQPDNHWLSGIVLYAVDAHSQGVLLPGTEAREASQRQWVSFDKMQRRDRG
ncbi:hypothetical protein [Rhodopirellula halodulae]|uniref:hypothetical protein n=1 Tax=Rhodopirellula halodulae TaxID=2894198 RepID=UPI001E4E1774|nr:hypothetical protein [Rhodopirellula sp. JC737]MCC9654635.1 hypothetical protein [Rhodopirellula sp. JC737]